MAAFRPGNIVEVYDPSRVTSSHLPPTVAGAMWAARLGGASQACICAGIACSLPRSEPEEAATMVRTFAQQTSPGRARVR